MFPDEHMMCMMQIFLLWETVWVAFEFCSRIVKRHSSHFKSTSITGNWMNITDRLAAAFFNRWLAADVPPGWQLVSQVVLALHITPLRGGGGVIGRIGRERCSVKVHYSSHHMLNPACGASSLAREAAPPSLFFSRSQPSLPSLIWSTTRLNLNFYAFLLLHFSLWGFFLLFWHRQIPLTLSLICLNFDKQGHTHPKKEEKKNRCGIFFPSTFTHNVTKQVFIFLMFCDRHSQQRKRKNDLCQIKWQTDRRIFPQAKCVISFFPPFVYFICVPLLFCSLRAQCPPVAFSFAVVSLSIDCFHIATSCAVWSQKHAAGSESGCSGALRFPYFLFCLSWDWITLLLTLISSLLFQLWSKAQHKHSHIICHWPN